ncbi:class GN sortase [Saccharobesus litoralis]|uniref:Class GN sortase n=1 Tax=Saccharobesus litoralis TaxID=2172099 RepID=A0A2S0VSI7_9ALTE|nr:class GN sortase [Saccharobesus litoralis]AWB67142.1 class GN sortase [Saccharobesus litoralis]
MLTKILKWLIYLGLIVGLFIGGEAAYLFGKAQVAQMLLHQSWQQTLDDGAEHKPWSWADTYPVAKLINHRTQDSWIVLSGMNGRTMAFGPGWKQDSATPNQFGNTVIAAHNDSHFSQLQTSQIGDQLSLQSANGVEFDYKITHIDVVHQSDISWFQIEQDMRLTLITCYPFQSNQRNTEQRYIVQAIAM